MAEFFPFKAQMNCLKWLLCYVHNLFPCLKAVCRNLKYIRLNTKWDFYNLFVECNLQHLLKQITHLSFLFTSPTLGNSPVETKAPGRLGVWLRKFWGGGGARHVLKILHTLVWAWFSMSSTVEECWLQTFMLVCSCMFFSYSRTSSIVISERRSRRRQLPLLNANVQWGDFRERRELSGSQERFQKQGLANFIKSKP